MSERGSAGSAGGSWVLVWVFVWVFVTTVCIARPGSRAKLGVSTPASTTAKCRRVNLGVGKPAPGPPPSPLPLPLPPLHFPVLLPLPPPALELRMPAAAGGNACAEVDTCLPHVWRRLSTSVCLYICAVCGERWEGGREAGRGEGEKCAHSHPPCRAILLCTRSHNPDHTHEHTHEHKTQTPTQQEERKEEERKEEQEGGSFKANNAVNEEEEGESNE